MKTSPVSRAVVWSVRGVLLLALLFGLALPASAQDEFGFATITLYAPGAPAGAWTSVQWQDSAGTWRNVADWQGAFDAADDAAGTVFKQWAVYPKDYGRGPFRWVVSTAPGGSVWATSARFFLPDGDGASLVTTLAPQSASAAANPQAGIPAVNYSTITLHAPGAPEGAAVGVQWRDETGGWHDVEGWQSTLDTSTVTEEPFKQWGVYAKDYGAGPFRWIVYAEPGGAVLATSPRFFLPNGNGANVTMTVLRQIAVVPADSLTAEMVLEPTTLPAQTSTSDLNCVGPCNSVISVSVPNAMAGNQVGVQWQDPFGLWHDVPTWQGSLVLTDNRSTPYQQWSISPELQGRGPFRWVVYNALGDTVMGVTPGFMLPDRSGVNLNVTVPQDVSDIAG
jgi:hypothetical protein